VRTIDVRPLAAGSVEAEDVALFVVAEARALLSVPEVIAVSQDAQLVLEGSLDVDGDELRIAATLSEGGVERASWTESLPIGQGLQLGQLLARATLLALGEDAAAPAEVGAPPVPAEEFLSLCRALRLLATDPDLACDELLLLLERAPSLEAPRRLLLDAAREAVSTERMPVLFAALERLVLLRPGDVEALVALGDYRALHFEDDAARELYLEARDLAPDAATSAEVASRLAALALRRGQEGEAIAHLRAAIKLADEPLHYLQLGLLLQDKEPAEALRMHSSAAVLAPDDARIRLELVRALRKLGGDPERTLDEAVEALRLARGDAELEPEAQAELDALV
jgi:tetratricopeptide (TPR) repeat protein